jgi:hypothetical protein
MTDPAAADVRLTIRPLPDAEAPAAIRLRRWLKMGLRVFGLRCTAFEKVPAGAHQRPQAATEAIEAASGLAEESLAEEASISNNTKKRESTHARR